MRTYKVTTINKKDNEILSIEIFTDIFCALTFIKEQSDFDAINNLDYKYVLDFEEE